MRGKQPTNIRPSLMNAGHLVPTTSLTPPHSRVTRARASARDLLEMQNPRPLPGFLEGSLHFNKSLR